MDKVEAYWEWREEMRSRHRTMTAGEYAAWCRGGDGISCSSSTDAFPGGLTILLDTPPIIGKVSRE